MRWCARRGFDGTDRQLRRQFGPEWDDWSIDVVAIHSLGDVVVVEGRYHGVYKPTSRRMNVEVCHVWRFRDTRLRLIMGRSL